MPYELKTEEIQVCGEVLTITQASNLMDIERSQMISAAKEATKDKQYPEGTRGNYERYLDTLLYPSLCACTFGDVPTAEEFSHSIPIEEANKWISAAQKLNPAWFSFLNSTEEDVEKKE